MPVLRAEGGEEYAEDDEDAADAVDGEEVAGVEGATGEGTKEEEEEDLDGPDPGDGGGGDAEGVDIVRLEDAETLHIYQHQKTQLFSNTIPPTLIKPHVQNTVAWPPKTIPSISTIRDSPTHSSIPCNHALAPPSGGFSSSYCLLDTLLIEHVNCSAISGAFASSSSFSSFSSACDSTSSSFWILSSLCVGSCSDSVVFVRDISSFSPVSCACSSSRIVLNEEYKKNPDNPGCYMNHTRLRAASGETKIVALSFA